MSDDSPSLYLITPRLSDAAAFAPVLEAALDAGVIACVLLLLEARDEGVAKKIVRTLATVAQERGAALRVEAAGAHRRGIGRSRHRPRAPALTARISGRPTKTVRRR